MSQQEESGMQDVEETPGEVTPEEVGQTGDDTQSVGEGEIVGDEPGPVGDEIEE